MAAPSWWVKVALLIHVTWFVHLSVLAFTATRARLDEVATMEFVRGENTTRWRAPPVPQLACGNLGDVNNGTGRDAAELVLVRCQNVKVALRFVEFSCDAVYGDGAKSSVTQAGISCGGVADAKDAYLVPGSCRMQYDLVKIGHDEERATQFSVLVFTLSLRNRICASSLFYIVVISTVLVLGTCSPKHYNYRRRRWASIADMGLGAGPAEAMPLRAQPAPASAEAVLQSTPEPAEATSLSVDTTAVSAEDPKSTPEPAASPSPQVPPRGPTALIFTGGAYGSYSAYVQLPYFPDEEEEYIF